MRVLVAPRNSMVAWSADLDGDGSPEWVLESHKARAVFSAQDGGRWMEFTWKDRAPIFCPNRARSPRPARWRSAPPATRWISRAGAGSARCGWRMALTVEQTTALPPDHLAPEKVGNTSLSIEHVTPMRAIYTLR